MGNLFHVTGRMNYKVLLEGRKRFICFLKFCLYFKEDDEAKSQRGAREFSIHLLSVCHGVSFRRDVVF